MNIGDKVKVKFHPMKEWEPDTYEIVSVYLNDFIVRKNPMCSARTVHKDLVEKI